MTVDVETEALGEMDYDAIPEWDYRSCRHVLVAMLKQVLDDCRGVGCITQNFQARREEQDHLKEEAMYYVFRDLRDENAPGSLRWLCLQLGISVGKVRKRALDLANLPREQAKYYWRSIS